MRVMIVEEAEYSSLLDTLALDISGERLHFHSETGQASWDALPSPVKDEVVKAVQQHFLYMIYTWSRDKWRG